MLDKPMISLETYVKDRYLKSKSVYDYEWERQLEQRRETFDWAMIDNHLINNIGIIEYYKGDPPPSRFYTKEDFLMKNCEHSGVETMDEKPRGIEIFQHNGDGEHEYWDFEPAGAIAKAIITDVKPIPQIVDPPTYTYEEMHGTVVNGEQCYRKVKL